jgi:hypothetical protein
MYKLKYIKTRNLQIKIQYQNQKCNKFNLQIKIQYQNQFTNQNTISKPEMFNLQIKIQYQNQKC